MRRIPRKVALMVLLAVGMSGCGAGEEPIAGMQPAEERAAAAQPAEVELERQPIVVQPAEGGKEELRIDPVEAITTKLPAADKAPKAPRTGLFETTLETQETEEGIEISFALKNISGKDLSLQFGSGQQYDIWVYDEQDNLVYQSSHGYAYTMAIIPFEMKAGEERTFQELWERKDNEGKPVPDGTYRIEVMVMARLQEGQADPGQFAAKTIVKIRNQ